MTKDRNAGVPKPMAIPMNVPLLGGQGGVGEKKISIPDAVQQMMQQMGSVMAGLEQLTNANNTMAMELELQKTRVTALEAKATLIPDKIEVTVKHEHQSPLFGARMDPTMDDRNEDRAVTEKRTVR